MYEMSKNGCTLSKGQLLSKGLFGLFNSPKKTNEKFLPQ